MTFSGGRRCACRTPDPDQEVTSDDIASQSRKEEESSEMKTRIIRRLDSGLNRERLDALLDHSHDDSIANSA